ncbi:hypothetical protein Tco_0295611 [Tanacetum coccineum]
MYALGIFNIPVLRLRFEGVTECIRAMVIENQYSCLLRHLLLPTLPSTRLGQEYEHEFQDESSHYLLVIHILLSHRLLLKSDPRRIRGDVVYGEDKDEEEEEEEEEEEHLALADSLTVYNVDEACFPTVRKEPV